MSNELHHMPVFSEHINRESKFHNDWTLKETKRE